MSFPQASSISPAGRGAVTVEFYIPDPTKPEERRAGLLGVQIRYSDGRIEEKRFDLLARLEDDAEGCTIRDHLLALETYILARIDAEILGV